MQKIISSNHQKYLLLCGPVTAIAVSPFTSYDPINLVKLLIVTTTGFYFLGVLISQQKKFLKEFKYVTISVGLFVAAMISTFFFSGAPKTQQIWGMFGRNTGLLTYFSLTLILLAFAVSSEKNLYAKVVYSLLIVAIPITIYSLIQVAKLDPIGWSSKDIFATFGNANFLSAFLGLSSLASFINVFNMKIKKVYRYVLFFNGVVQSLIILRSKSIQGFMIMVAGLGIVIFYVLKVRKAKSIFSIIYSCFSIISLLLVLFALFDRGPLAKFIFQPSIIFRSDYIHAGWKMLITHPLFGVGLDSYGDWYRALRGSISTLRTGPDRTANTAHNIFLDIGSNGGFPLLLAYLLILSLALWSAKTVWSRSQKFDPIFITVFSCWVAYQIQALVSINQIGVGVWGWIFTGVLIGYSKIEAEQESGGKISGKTKRKNKSNDIQAGLFGFVFALIGFLLAFVPFNADMKYKSAVNSRDLGKMIESVKNQGSTAWHVSNVVEAALSNNFVTQAKELDEVLIKKYPRDFFGWRVQYLLAEANSEAKKKAFLKLKELDPFNPTIDKS